MGRSDEQHPPTRHRNRKHRFDLRLNSRRLSKAESFAQPFFCSKSHYFYLYILLDKSNDFIVYCIRTIITRRRSWLSRKKNIIPDYESVTPFLKGQASKIFKEVADSDKVLIIQKQNKPQNVVISYERYLELKKNGADI